MIFHVSHNKVSPVNTVFNGFRHHHPQQTPPAISEIIKTQRKAKGWSQRHLAEICFTSQQNIHRIESGCVKHSRSIDQIMGALGLIDGPASKSVPDYDQIITELKLQIDVLQSFVVIVTEYLNNQNIEIISLNKTLEAWEENLIVKHI